MEFNYLKTENEKNMLKNLVFLLEIKKLILNL